MAPKTKKGKGSGTKAHTEAPVEPQEHGEGESKLSKIDKDTLSLFGQRLKAFIADRTPRAEEEHHEGATNPKAGVSRVKKNPSAIPKPAVAEAEPFLEVTCKLLQLQSDDLNRFSAVIQGIVNSDLRDIMKASMKVLNLYSELAEEAESIKKALRFISMIAVHPLGISSHGDEVVSALVRFLESVAQQRSSATSEALLSRATYDKSPESFKKLENFLEDLLGMKVSESVRPTKLNAFEQICECVRVQFSPNEKAAPCSSSKHHEQLLSILNALFWCAPFWGGFVGFLGTQQCPPHVGLWSSA